MLDRLRRWPVTPAAAAVSLVLFGAASNLALMGYQSIQVVFLTREAGVSPAAAVFLLCSPLRRARDLPTAPGSARPRPDLVQTY
ncbi:hypothetical protein [Streptomyces sp. NPDC017529]|uniref:hypothetical protein n=1 Tax=Streptomyces sp. NPDC017529 TaxID=3365000 RepID=UPI0037B6A936